MMFCLESHPSVGSQGHSCWYNTRVKSAGVTVCGEAGVMCCRLSAFDLLPFSPGDLACYVCEHESMNHLHMAPLLADLHCIMHSHPKLSISCRLLHQALCIEPSIWQCSKRHCTLQLAQRLSRLDPHWMHHFCMWTCVRTPHCILCKVYRHCPWSLGNFSKRVLL